MTLRGKLISLEGIEGVGKSSNVNFVAECLRKRGKTVLVTREPGGTPMAEDIRKILLADYAEKTLPKTELLLLYAGRLQHVSQVIEPALAEGKWVVCDRFFDATYAYQGGGRGIDEMDIQRLNEWTLGGFEPDCTLLLDAPVDVAFQRIRQHRTLDRFEKEQQAFFQRIRDCYLRLAEQKARFHVIDATQNLPQVQAQVKTVIDQVLETA